MDIVYLWVDGSDPRVQRYRASRHCPYQTTNHGELRYSLASVRAHAPWARRVIVVSECGVKPAWAGEFPAVEWVDQDTLLPAEAVPVFNNMVLEAYLHRVPGLSEPFLYMNDDYFLGQDVVPAMWLEPQWTFFRAQKTLPIAVPESHEWAHMTVKTADLAQRKWGGARARFLQHTPYLMSGRAMEAVLADCADELRPMMRRHDKRHPHDLVPLLLMQEWLLQSPTQACGMRTLSGATAPSYYFTSINTHNYAQVLARARAQPFHMITLNDSFGEHAGATRQLQSTLQLLYPALCVVQVHQPGLPVESFTKPTDALRWAARQSEPSWLTWGGGGAPSREQWQQWARAVPSALAWDAIFWTAGARLQLQRLQRPASQAASQAAPALACALQPHAATRLLEGGTLPQQLSEHPPADMRIYTSRPAPARPSTAFGMVF